MDFVFNAHRKRLYCVDVGFVSRPDFDRDFDAHKKWFPIESEFIFRSHGKWPYGVGIESACCSDKHLDQLQQD